MRKTLSLFTVFLFSLSLVSCTNIDLTLQDDVMDIQEKLLEKSQEQIAEDGYYGSNLDALYDVLITYNESLEISVINKEKLLENLGN